MGAAIITNRADTAPDLALYKDGVFLLEEGIIDPSENGVETDNEDIRLYLEKISQKYGTVRTLLNPYQQTPVRNIYVCNDIVLCDNLCLMYFESGKYHFTHRSFQEYFCALFFSKQKDRTLEGIGDFFDNLRSRNYGDKTFSMLYDMIPGKIDEYVFIPYLKKLFEECDAGDGYWTFLETMY